MRWLAVLLVLAAVGCSHTSTPDRSTRSSAPSSAPATSTTISTTTEPPSPSTSASTVSPIPPLSAKARAAGLIDVRTIVPDAVVDLRYATSHNFTGVRLYPTTARCLVHVSMAAGLKAAALQLRRAGYVIVFWDCYRPHSVQVRMFQIVPDPNWVARPGPYATSHEAGRSVDVTLAYRRGRHRLLDMGTGFDDFTPRAYAYATYGISPRAHANRALLRNGMGAGGLTVYSGEWWHFDGPGADVGRPHLNAPLS